MKSFSRRLFVIIIIFSIGLIMGCGEKPQNDNARVEYLKYLMSQNDGFPKGAQPVVAIIHFRPFRGFIDTPIIPSDLINTTLISKLGELLEDPNYNIEKLKKDCGTGRIGLNDFSFNILRMEGISDSDIRILKGSISKQIAQLEGELARRKGLDNAVKDLGIFVSPPNGWQEPFIIGEKKPFISKLVMTPESFSPIHHMIWIDKNHEFNHGAIEVLVFAAGKFPIGVIAINPEGWIRQGAQLVVYKLNGEDVIAAPVEFKHGKAYKVRSEFTRSGEDEKTIEDAIYFSTEKAFVAIRLRCYRSSFERMDKEVFHPFLDNIVFK